MYMKVTRSWAHKLLIGRINSLGRLDQSSLFSCSPCLQTGESVWDLHQSLQRTRKFGWWESFKAPFLYECKKSSWWVTACTLLKRFQCVLWSPSRFHGRKAFWCLPAPVAGLEAVERWWMPEMPPFGYCPVTPLGTRASCVSTELLAGCGKGWAEPLFESVT